MTAQVTDIRPHLMARARICSGGCSFFSPQYEYGRKVAGLGACQKHDSQFAVQVGINCLWAQPRSIAEVSAPPMAQHR